VEFPAASKTGIIIISKTTSEKMHHHHPRIKMKPASNYCCRKFEDC
jgi:hypothetical protein